MFRVRFGGPHHASAKKSDAIVVLGAAQDNGAPTAILAERIATARTDYEAGLAPLIITVGGGQKGDLSTEAASSRKSLIAQRIPQSHIVAIPIGKDTLSSTIAYVTYMKLRNMKSVIISTDPYHCYRAMAEARGLGISATCAPVQSGPGSLKSTGLKYIIRETGAYLAYETVGRFGIHLSDQIKNRLILLWVLRQAVELPGYSQSDRDRFLSEPAKRQGRTEFARDRARIFIPLHCAVWRLKLKSQCLGLLIFLVPDSRIRWNVLKLVVNLVGRLAQTQI